MRTQVAIIGCGPAGLLLAELLHHHGVESVVLEKHTREHVLGRIRAGVLEPWTVDLLREHGLAARLEREGHRHDGVWIVWGDREFLELIDRDPERLAAMSIDDFMRLGGNEGAEVIMWLIMRGALDARAKKRHQNYYLPMTTAMAVALFE